MHCHWGMSEEESNVLSTGVSPCWLDVTGKGCHFNVVPPNDTKGPCTACPGHQNCWCVTGLVAAYHSECEMLYGCPLISCLWLHCSALRSQKVWSNWKPCLNLVALKCTEDIAGQAKFWNLLGLIWNFKLLQCELWQANLCFCTSVQRRSWDRWNVEDRASFWRPPNAALLNRLVVSGCCRLLYVCKKNGVIASAFPERELQALRFFPPKKEVMCGFSVRCTFAVIAASTTVLIPALCCLLSLCKQKHRTKVAITLCPCPGTMSFCDFHIIMHFCDIWDRHLCVVLPCPYLIS